MTVSAAVSPASRETPLPECPGGVLVTACFASTTFLGAFLLFLVQPLVAKYILPWFGGGAAVWTTCVLFFQAVLLGGYLYAHLGVSRLGARAQAVVHVLLLLVAAAVALPAIAPADRWKPAPDAGENPIGQILLLLLVTVGLPCLALSATSPLLHTWYSRLRPGAAVYRLFALSNLGSLLALLAYPLVVEPFLPRRAQAMAWSIALVAFAALCATCAILAMCCAKPSSEATDSATFIDSAAAAPRVGPVNGALWLALPACASALLLATTNTITQDFSPVPFLWVLPLALYLLTFIIAFDRPRWYRRRVFGATLAVCLTGTLLMLSQPREYVPLWVLVGTLTATMFVGCMTLHGELARLQPPATRLTAYYLAIAAGGALGGLLVGIGAPVLLTSYSELQITLWVCAFFAVVTPVAVNRRLSSAAAGVPVLAALVALALLLWTTSHPALTGATLRSRSRDFYGVLTLWDFETAQGKSLLLRHGSTAHGLQFLRPSLRESPTTYYHPRTGVGVILGKYSPLPHPRRVGLIGLGAGTLGAYAQAGDVYHFYEISPSVLRYAQDPFTYLSDLTRRGAKLKTTLGDGRLSMEREPAQNYDAIVLDAFSGDAIPVHLLTSEAFDVYKRHLGPSGVLCVHVSNLHLDLRPVVAAAAKRLGWEAVLFNSDVAKECAGYLALWIMLSPDPARIESLRKLGANRSPQQKPGFAPWTDEHTPVLGILR